MEAVAELISGRKMLSNLQAQDLWALDGNPAYDTVKRLTDIGLTLAALPLWLPLCLAAGLAVKLNTPGPMLFSQIRIGRNGREFRIWKLRSMRHEEATTARFAQPNDDRVTSVGKIIRRTRLDELPQLWNVLKGDMSLIGPRPEQAEFVRVFAHRIPAYPYRHLVRPGRVNDGGNEPQQSQQHGQVTGVGQPVQALPYQKQCRTCDGVYRGVGQAQAGAAAIRLRGGGGGLWGILLWGLRSAALKAC